MQKSKYLKMLIEADTPSTGPEILKSGENKIDIVNHYKERGRGTNKQIYEEVIEIDIDIDDILEPKDLDELDEQIRGLIARWRISRDQSPVNNNYKIRTDMFGYIFE